MLLADEAVSWKTAHRHFWVQLTLPAAHANQPAFHGSCHGRGFCCQPQLLWKKSRTTAFGGETFFKWQETSSTDSTAGFQSWGTLENSGVDERMNGLIETNLKLHCFRRFHFSLVKFHLFEICEIMWYMKNKKPEVSCGKLFLSNELLGPQTVWWFCKVHLESVVAFQRRQHWEYGRPKLQLSCFESTKHLNMTSLACYKTTPYLVSGGVPGVNKVISVTLRFCVCGNSNRLVYWTMILSSRWLRTSFPLRCFDIPDVS